MCTARSYGMMGAVSVTVYSRALLRATELVGGRDKLASVLTVPREHIDKWISGDANPPREVFLRVVDLILDETAPANGSDAQGPTPPRDAAGSSEHYRN